MKKIILVFLLNFLTTPPVFANFDVNKNLVLPVTVISRHGAECNVMTGKGKIPLFEISTLKEAKILQRYFEKTKHRLCYVMSEKESIIKTITQKEKSVIGVLDLRATGFEKEEAVRKIISSNCRIAMMKAKDITRENISCFSRFGITVWTEESKDDTGFYTAVLSGAGGVMTENPERLKERLGIFDRPSYLGVYNVYGHRGTAAYDVENTVSAAKSAITFGVNYIEIDVQTSKDGKLFLQHDKTTERMCVENLKIGECDTAELEKVSYRGVTEKIAELGSYLRNFKNCGDVVFNVEIKGDNPLSVTETVKAVRRAGVEDKVHISSFSSDINKMMRRSFPFIACGALNKEEFTDVKTAVLSAKYANETVAGADESIKRELMQMGYKRNVYINADDEYTAYGKSKEEYFEYVKKIPHEIRVENGNPTVYDRLGEKTEGIEIEKIETETVVIYTCPVKRADAPLYYIYSLPVKK